MEFPKAYYKLKVHSKLDESTKNFLWFNIFSLVTGCYGVQRMYLNTTCDRTHGLILLAMSPWIAILFIAILQFLFAFMGLVSLSAAVMMFLVEIMAAAIITCLWFSCFFVLLLPLLCFPCIIIMWIVILITFLVLTFLVNLQSIAIIFPEVGAGVTGVWLLTMLATLIPLTCSPILCFFWCCPFCNFICPCTVLHCYHLSCCPIAFPICGFFCQLCDLFVGPCQINRRHIAIKRKIFKELKKLQKESAPKSVGMEEGAIETPVPKKQKKGFWRRKKNEFE